MFLSEVSFAEESAEGCPTVGEFLEEERERGQKVARQMLTVLPGRSNGRRGAKLFKAQLEAIHLIRSASLQFNKKNRMTDS